MKLFYRVLIIYILLSNNLTSLSGMVTTVSPEKPTYTTYTDGEFSRDILTLSKSTFPTELQMVPCLPNGIVFSSQQQIDDFATDYPDCNEILGELRTASSDITNLLGLDQLEVIQGNLTILGSGINTLDGLENITTIDGNLNITLNNQLTELSGLENIITIGGSLILSNNNQLTELSGLENLTSVSGLSVAVNPLLASIALPSQITSINGNVFIKQNASLTDLSGMSNINVINGYLWFEENDLLADLSGITTINSCTDIYIFNNSAVLNISGFENAFCEKLIIRDNLNLQNITGFNSASFPDYIIIESNSSLENISGFSNIQSSEELKIENNSMLQSISGFNSFTEIIDQNNNFNTNSLRIMDCPNLTTISGLTQFHTGYLILDNLPQLNDIDFLSNMTNNPNPINIKNTGIQNLIGLSDLTFCSGFNLDGNPNISDLSGLSSLNGVESSFTIRNNSNLLSLNGLESLITIPYGISINNNPLLTNINAVKNVDISTYNPPIQFIKLFNISGNSNLSLCEIESVCEGINVDANDLVISNNLPGCNSTQEVEDRCNGIYPITSPTTDQCNTIPSITISASENNNNDLIHILDESGDILCSINANGNDLGVTDFDVYVSSTDRTNTDGNPYINRNISISPEIQPASPVTVRLYYTSADFDAFLLADANVNAVTDINFAKTSDGCVGVMPTGTDGIFQSTSGAYGSNGGVFVEANFNSFSTIFGVSESALPVVWSEPLSATTKTNSNQLRWQTSQEINNDRYEIEYSRDGRFFRLVGHIKAIGSENSTINYTYDHKVSNSGLYYYRIKQIDLDGQFSYSNIASCEVKSEVISIYPNPFHERIEINTSFQTQAFLINRLGIKLQVYNLEIGVNTFELNHLKSGIYFIKTSNSVTKIVRI
jgi:hypothetical protein